MLNQVYDWLDRRHGWPLENQCLIAGAPELPGCHS
jgi:hypothetical protein